MSKLIQNVAALPVTALCFVGNHLLAGEGSTVTVHDVLTKKKVASSNVFVGTAIHGLTACGECIAVHGSKDLKVLSWRENKLSSLCETIHISDWIWAVKWLENDVALPDTPTTPQYIALALGHNAVAMVDWSRNRVVREVHCEDKCILYSAHLIGSQWRSLVLAAGTVFNQIVLWPMQSASRDQTDQSDGKPSEMMKVLHRLSGHQGVIFNITTNPMRHQLCSVSDDRSIRLWRIASTNTDKPLSDWSLKSWQSARFEELHILYGHTARVWQAVLLNTWIVSVGEDATCIIWDYDGKIRKKIRGHQGRSIWSVACSNDERLVATGGGDTSIRISHLGDEEGVNSKWNSHSLNPCTGEEDYPKTVHLLGPDHMIVMTNTGLLKCYNSHDKSWNTIASDTDFFSYSVIATVANHNLVAMGNLSGLVKVYSLDGCVIATERIFEGKVCSLLCLQPGDNSASVKFIATGPDGNITLFELVLPPKEVTMHQVFDFILPHTRQRWVSAVCALPVGGLLVCGDRGGTVHVYKLGPQQVHKSTDSDSIQSTSDTFSETPQASNPIQSFPRIHSKVGVTDVCYHDNLVYTCGRDGHYRTFQVHTDGLSVLQANRVSKGWDWLSGMLCFHGDLYIMGFHSEQFVLHNISQSERMLTVDCGGGHRAWDFTVESLPAEGVDATADYYGNRSRFVFIKNREVVVCDARIESQSTIIKPPLHGRQINDVLCVFSQVGVPGQDDVCVLATAGEDSVVNLILCDSESLTVTSTLQGHISSIRCVATSHSCRADQRHDCKVLLSGGGRAQILVSRIWGRKYETDGGRSRYWAEQLSSHVAIEDGGIRKKKTWKTRDTVADPETRVMSIDAWNVTEMDVSLPTHLHVVSVGCSDAQLRIFLFDENTCKLELIAQSDFHKHCLLQTKHIIFEVANQNLALVISTSTDGTVAFWDITDLLYTKINTKHSKRNVPSEATYSGNCDKTENETWKNDQRHNSVDSRTKETSDKILVVSQQRSDISCHDNAASALGGPVWTRQIHQSGVNSLDIKHITGDTYMLVSGGDDNSINMVTLVMTFDLNLDIQEISSIQHMMAHAAQVTGVYIVDEVTILSVSIDQRLTYWQMNSLDKKLTMITSRFVDVADVSNLAVWKDKDSLVRIAVTGVGLQTFSLQDL